MKKLLFFLSFFLTFFASFGQITYNAKEIFLAGSSGTQVKDTANFCVSNPCPQGTLVWGAKNSDTTVYIRTRTGWQALQHGAPTVITASQGLTKVGNDIRLGGTTTGGTLTTISSVQGNGLKTQMFDATSHGGSWQVSPAFSIMTQNSNTNPNGFTERYSDTNLTIEYPTNTNRLKIDGANNIFNLRPSGTTLGVDLDNSAVTSTAPNFKAVGTASDVPLVFTAKNNGNVYLTNNSPVSGLFTLGLGDPANTTLTNATITPFGTNANISLNLLGIGTGTTTLGGSTTTDSNVKVSTGGALTAQSPSAAMVLTSGTGASANHGVKLLLNNTTPTFTVQDFVAIPTSSIVFSPLTASLVTTKLTSGAPSTFTINSGDGIAGATSGQGLTIKSGNGSAAANGDLTLATGTSGTSTTGDVILKPQHQIKLQTPSGSGAVSIVNSQTTGGINITSVLDNVALSAANTLLLNGQSTDAGEIQIGNASSGDAITMSTAFADVNVNSGGAINLIGGSTSIVTTSGNTVYNVNSIAGNIPQAFDGSATLDFPNTTTGVSDLTLTVTGAAVGDRCVTGIPNGSVTTTASFWCWVSAPNTVTIRFSPKAIGGENPASGTFTATVFKKQ